MSKNADFYLQSKEFVQHMWNHLTCYRWQHYLSVVAAHRCLESSNPEKCEVVLQPGQI